MRNLVILFTIVLITQTCAAQTWIRQNPYPFLAQIMDIDFDGLHGLAVGQESTIFTTSNGGITWTPQRPPHIGVAYDAPIVVPGTAGQIMFAGGFQLIVTRDGGHTWDIAHNSLGRVYKVQILPGGELMAHGADYSVISTDLGMTWEVISLPGFNTEAGYFTSPLKGWVQHGGFNNNQVWVTTDGGANWNVRDTLRHPVISGIHMLTDDIGFLSARDYVYKTTDGGHTWDRLHDNAVNSIQDMHVVNENEIWTCQINGFIFYTLSGGAFWTNVNPNIINSNKTNGIYANDAGGVWAGSKFVSILYSANYANTWTDQIPNSKEILFDAFFVDEETGIVGGAGGTVLTSTNGGASWEKHSFGSNDHIYSVGMAGSDILVAGSSNGNVFLSENAGTSWNTIGEDLGQISGLYSFSRQTHVAVSEFGRIYKTTNGGTHWDEVFTDPGSILLGLEFVDDQHGWACGWFGTILYTDNGGENWSLQYADGRTQFTDISFINTMQGWAVSSGFTDTLWHTFNGGQSWETSVLPYRTFWAGVSFHSADTGWISGGSSGAGVILRTNDGGQTWLLDHQSPESLFDIFAVPGKETVWSVGIGGNIVKYSPCAFTPVLGLLSGDLTPCQTDTVTYTIVSSDVDIFEWTFPAGWLIFGNPNTSSIQVIAGASSGTVSVMGRDACGTMTGEVSLTVSPLPVDAVQINYENDVLTCEVDVGFYQWLLNGVPVSGATGQTYVPVAGGLYEVVVTSLMSGCEARSNAIQVVLVSVFDAIVSGIKLYPNPTSDMLYIEMPASITRPQPGKIRVYDLNGMLRIEAGIFTSKIDVTGLGLGVYYIEIQIDSHTHARKIILH